MIIAGILAGTGVYQMAERVIQRYINDPLVEVVWVLTPKDRFRNRGFMMQDKIRHINSWEGEDSHSKTGINRERMRCRMYENTFLVGDAGATAEWFIIGDEDGLPAPDYFAKLDKIKYDYPVLLTGKTFNADGARWFDICSFQTDSVPFCVPYDDWENSRWLKDLYCSGNQHVMNRSGFNLDVQYKDIPGEDPWYCRSFRKAGGRLIFRPELSMWLQKVHPRANMGNEATLPK
jgi:hypothetical protein